ncbi:MAG: SIS domain-containing protein [archaeon]
MKKGSGKKARREKIVDRAFYERIAKFPESIEEAISLGEKTTIPLRYYRKYSRVAVAGMGASGAGGDYLADLAPYLDIACLKAYEIPPYFGQETLFIAISFSGKTEETISAAALAHKKGCHVIGMGIPAKLKELCSKIQVPHVDFPAYYQPSRIGAAFVAFAPAAVLGKLGMMHFSREDIKETVKECRKIRETCGQEVPEKENPAKKFARDLAKLPVVIYVPSSLSSLGKKLKDDFAESGKVLAKWEALPEANHNDLSVWQERPNASAIIVRSGKDETEREKEGLALSERVLKKYSRKFAKLTLPQANSKFARLFAGVYFGMFVSYYLGVFRGIKAIGKTPLQDAVKGKLTPEFTQKTIEESAPKGGESPQAFLPPHAQ